MYVFSLIVSGIDFLTNHWFVIVCSLTLLFVVCVVCLYVSLVVIQRRLKKIYAMKSTVEGLAFWEKTILKILYRLKVL